MEPYKEGKKYTEEEYIELSIQEMMDSKSEHIDRADPKVGAVLVDKDGAYVAKAHRGELRSGDHAEYTLLERKYPNTDLSGYTLYTTLEPCVKRRFPKKGCYKRAINARIGRVVIGHHDPDPTVRGNGIRLLKEAGITVDFYDRKYEKQIADANDQFFKEAERRAKDEKTGEIRSAINPIENELVDFNLTDLSDQAQQTMIDKMGLSYKLGSDGYKSYLNKMNLIAVDPESGARPTGLGLLLLGTSPQQQFPQARIKFTIRKEGEDPKIKDFEGPLVLLPGLIQEYLEFIFPKGFSPRTSFDRTESVDPSSSALFEVIMNAIVHRDYTIDGARIMVNVDDDKIDVLSPGEPLCSLDKLNSFIAPSVSRNPKIAHIFFDMGLVEERGFGLEELSKMESLGLQKPTFEMDENLLMTTIYRDTESFTSIKNEKLKGLRELEEHKILTSSQYEEIAEVSGRTARRHLNELVKADKATKKGNGPSTEYRIK